MESASRRILADEANVAIAIALQVKSYSGDVLSWVNFPLMNSTGENDDLLLQPYSGCVRPTKYSDQFPATMKFISWLRELGLDISHARIAVLLQRDVLRPHVDTHRTIRLIIPLNDQGADFRHVIGPFAIAMRTGDIWIVDGRICHGAANVSDRNCRAALLLDARPATSMFRESDSSQWRIPGDRMVHRKKWDNEARARSRQRFYSILHSHGIEAAEKEWHFTSFEFDMPPQLAYHELISLCRKLAGDQQSSARAA
jgi:hypothetical protein